MSPAVQTLVALALVVLAGAGLITRTLWKKKSPGCGGDCGCPSRDLKIKSRG